VFHEAFDWIFHKIDGMMHTLQLQKGSNAMVEKKRRRRERSKIIKEK